MMHGSFGALRPPLAAALHDQIREKFPLGDFFIFLARIANFCSDAIRAKVGLRQLCRNVVLSFPYCLILLGTCRLDCGGQTMRRICVYTYISFSLNLSLFLPPTLSLSTDTRTDAHTCERSTAYLIIMSSRIDATMSNLTRWKHAHANPHTHIQIHPPPPTHARTPRSKDRTFHTLIPQFCAFCGQPITTYSEVCTPMHCHVNIYTNHESCHTHECASHIF